MNFKISNVQHYLSPPGLNPDEILNSYGTSLIDLKNSMKDAIFVRRDNFPITKDLAKHLEDLLERFFMNSGAKLHRCGYSPTLGETPDAVIGREGGIKKIFIEIEFRPNEHKDILKFLIGYKQKTLELGIMILAMDRDAINKGYYTMPEYDKCVQIVKELQSDCPILVMGIDGEWFSEQS